MDRACSQLEDEQVCKIQNGRDHFEDLDVGGRIILKSISDR
jgi:hypothetical protein